MSLLGWVEDPHLEEAADGSNDTDDTDTSAWTCCHWSLQHPRILFLRSNDSDWSKDEDDAENHSNSMVQIMRAHVKQVKEQAKKAKLNVDDLPYYPSPVLKWKVKLQEGPNDEAGK